MAQTGFTPISLYYTTTASAAPTAGNLVAGELAINTNDGKLFYKDSSGVVQVIGTKGGVGSATTTQVLYNSSGLVVGSANLTFNGTTLTVANDASISSLTVGKGGGAVASNTVAGAGSSLSVNTSGNFNTAFGYQTLVANTTGSSNTAIGQGTLYSNISGGNNSALGQTALLFNSTGSNNTGLGYGALYSNTTASYNTAVGYQAGYSNTTGADGTFIGYQAGYSFAGGSQSGSVCVGKQAGYLTTGNYNTLIGFAAGYNLTSGTQNCFVGPYTSGGQSSGGIMTTGSKNSIFGAFNGNQGGLDIRTASNYIVLSDGDGNPRGIFDGSGNLLVGTTTPASYAQNTIVGASLSALLSLSVVHKATNSNVRGIVASCPNFSGDDGYLYIGSRSTGDVLYIRTNGNIQNLNNSYGAISDIKLKENIEDATPKLADLMKVKIRSYNLKATPDHKQIGVIAQELEEVFPSLVEESETPDKSERIKTVKYSVFVPMLIKAIQELNAKVTALEAQLGA
jgi:hypothetical protein